MAHKRHIQSGHLQFLGPQLWAAITAATTQFCNAIGDFLCDTHVLSNAACHILCCMLGSQERSTDPSALGSLIISGRAGSTPGACQGTTLWFSAPSAQVWMRTYFSLFFLKSDSWAVCCPTPFRLGRKDHFQFSHSGRCVIVLVPQ